MFTDSNNINNSINILSPKNEILSKSTGLFDKYKDVIMKSWTENLQTRNINKNYLIEDAEITILKYFDKRYWQEFNSFMDEEILKDHPKKDQEFKKLLFKNPQFWNEIDAYLELRIDKVYQDHLRDLAEKVKIDLKHRSMTCVVWFVVNLRKGFINLK